MLFTSVTQSYCEFLVCNMASLLYLLLPLPTCFLPHATHIHCSSQLGDRCLSFKTYFLGDNYFGRPQVNVLLTYLQLTLSKNLIQNITVHFLFPFQNCEQLKNWPYVLVISVFTGPAIQWLLINICWINRTLGRHNFCPQRLHRISGKWESLWLRHGDKFYTRYSRYYEKDEEDYQVSPGAFWKTKQKFKLGK